MEDETPQITLDPSEDQLPSTAQQVHPGSEVPAEGQPAEGQ